MLPKHKSLFYNEQERGFYKVKRRLSMLLAVAFLLLITCNALAAENNGIILNYDLTYNGRHTATVETGTVITVVYNLLNASADEDYTISSITNEISFDDKFFEYMGDGKIEKDPLTVTAKMNVYSWGEHRVYFNGFHMNKTTYSSRQFLGSFKLKVKAASGSSTISSKALTAFDDSGKRYNTTSENLTVFVGNEPAELFKVVYMNDGAVYKTIETSGKIKIETAPSVRPGYKFAGWENNGKVYQPGDEFNVDENVTFTAKWEEAAEPSKKYTLTFETNGGTAVNAVTKEENTVVDLSKYTTSKSGYSFGGWYADSLLTQKVSSVTLDGNKTVYAKWVKLSSGGNVTKYTLSFETNGGSKIESVLKVKNTAVDLSKYITKKEGYSFDGWYTDKELTNKVAEIKITSDTVLYAKWVEGDNGYTDKPNYKPDIFSNNHNAYIVGSNGGYVYPGEKLTRAEAAEIFFRLLNEEVRAEALSAENDFVDVNESDWYNTAVSTLSNLEVLKGRTKDSFAPGDKITRAELTAIIARLSEATYEGDDLFTDISGHWAEKDINISSSINWVNGDNGKFRPDDYITRAEVIALINRALNRQPETKDDLLDDMITAPDNTDENAWYYIAVQEATNSHDYEKKADGIHEKWIKLTKSSNSGK